MLIIIDGYDTNIRKINVNKPVNNKENRNKLYDELTNYIKTFRRYDSKPRNIRKY